MRRDARGGGSRWWTMAVLMAIAPMAGWAGSEVVTLKTGATLRGMVDKDNTIVSIFDPDGLKRVIIRDSKIARIDPDPGLGKIETFALVQPMTTHAGSMPTAAVGIKAGEWDKFGRRSFSYVGPRGGKPVEMTQAIIGLGPKVCKIRGVDGFWQGQIATASVPKDSVLAILAKIDRSLLNERLRVIRFLIQAEWYAEARVEVENLVKEFLGKNPEVAEQGKAALALIQEQEAQGIATAINQSRQAQQPKTVLAKLRSFPSDGVPAPLLVTIRDQLRQEEARIAADRELAEAIRRNVGEHGDNKGRLFEMLAALSEAPDAVRGRFEPFEKARAEGVSKPQQLAALAVSGFYAGADQATAEPADADAIAQADRAARLYLVSLADSERSKALADLANLSVGGSPITLELLTAICRSMPPPLREIQTVEPGKPTLLRVRDDPNLQQPTEYAVLLPPEYHPRRSYPAIIALHGDETVTDTAQWWGAEAAKRGFIVVAPEYNLRDRPRDYRYTSSEHAAVTLTIRDARRRFAIDSDRVFLGGNVFGGDMAWDYGLAHPDLFAGIVAVSPIPAKYPWAIRSNAARVPMYVVMGDLSPAEQDIFFGQLARPMMTAPNGDLTFVEYYRRGRERFPEEAGPAFDWIANRRREPNPMQFETVAARDCDDRFYGVVIRGFTADRVQEPATVEIYGKNLKPATLGYRASRTANPSLINLTTAGITQMDVWVGPKNVDFSKKLEIRVNRRTMYKGAAKPDPESLLEDLRIRGDRSQVYWLRVPINLGGGRN